VRDHYAGLAAEYDEHWVCGPEYVPWMANRITQALRLGPDRAEFVIRLDQPDPAEFYR
jgi:hypothetical protein